MPDAVLLGAYWLASSERDDQDVHPSRWRVGPDHDGHLVIWSAVTVVASAVPAVAGRLT
ncbi:hypothetical protein [Streptomyces mirabilis]|uniref:hypothetical protein n=1 Tax=Streptomyces mirabilis TaxID=68239 RepID=UPI0036CD9141